MKYELPTHNVYKTKLPSKHPWYSAILNLRLVCKDWRVGIDKFYENRDSLFAPAQSVTPGKLEMDLDFDDERHHDFEVYEVGTWAYYLFDASKRQDQYNIAKFLKHFNESHRPDLNPFVGREVTFEMGWVDEDFSDADFSRFTSEMTKLLTKYGTHIWFCNFSKFQCLDYSSVVENVAVFIQWLTLMPNLKVLRIGMGLRNDELDDSESLEIKTNLETRGVHVLPQLEFVSFDYVPEFFITDLLEKNSHINKLELHFGDKVDLNRVPLPNLVHFSYSAASLEEYELLETFGNLWPLQTLHIDVADDFPYTPRQRIFKFIETWQNTLTDVAVYLPKAVLEEDKKSVIMENDLRLNLPKATRCRLELPSISTIDFILPMKSLKLLEIRMNVDREWESVPLHLQTWLKENEIIQFSADWDEDMYTYNIWKLFPKMKRIHTCESMYTHWEQTYSYVRRKCKLQ